MARKPDDRRALPLNRGCHMRQHAYGDEAGWWAAHGFPGPSLLHLTNLYHARYRMENPNANPPYVRKQRSIKARKPKAQRTKIKGRGFGKQHRPFPKGKPKKPEGMP